MSPGGIFREIAYVFSWFFSRSIITIKVMSLKYIVKKLEKGTDFSISMNPSEVSTMSLKERLIAISSSFLCSLPFSSLHCHFARRGPILIPCVDTRFDRNQDHQSLQSE